MGISTEWAVGAGALAGAVSAALASTRSRSASSAGGQGASITIAPWVSVVFGGLVGAAVGAHFAHMSAFLAYLALAVCAVPLSVIDLATFKIPNRMLGLAAAASLLGLIYALPRGGAAPLERGLLAAAVVGVAFLGLAIVAGGGFGLGDVKLLAYLALLTGYQSWSLVLVSLLAGFVIAAVAAATLRRVRYGSQLALAPWLIGGAVVALVV